MGIRFQCHHCGNQLNVKDFQAGRKGRCPVCKGQFRIPLSDAQYSLDPSESMETSAEAGASEAQELVAAQQNQSGSVATAASRSTSPSRPTIPARTSTSPGNDVAASATQENNLGAPKVDAKQSVVQENSGIDQIQPRVIAEAPTATWYVRPASGGQYGPAPTAVVWQWLIEDRIGHDSLIWREDWPEWYSASQVFSEYFSEVATQPSGFPQAATVSAQPTTVAASEHSLPAIAIPNPSLNLNPNSSSSGSSSAVSARELRKRSRRMKYTVAISVLAVVLITLAIGLVVVLYQQGILGGSQPR